MIFILGKWIVIVNKVIKSDLLNNKLVVTLIDYLKKRIIIHFHDEPADDLWSFGFNEGAGFACWSTLMQNTVDDLHLCTEK